MLLLVYRIAGNYYGTYDLRIMKNPDVCRFNICGSWRIVFNHKEHNP